MFRVSCSIIVPVFNVESYIADCLQSVMQQTYSGSLECILVDDCGTDGSMEIAKKMVAEYKGRIEFKVLHHEHNRGLAAARNTGMDAATGEYVYFLDSDDWISDDCIEQLIEPLCDKRYDVVVGDFITFGGDSSVRLWVERDGVYIGDELKDACYHREIYVMAWNKLYNHDFIKKNRLSFYEGIIHEDELWSYYVTRFASSMFVAKQAKYFYRIHADSIIDSTKKDGSKAASSLNTIVYQIVSDDYANSSAYSEARNIYIISLFLRYIQYDWGNKKRIRELYMFIRRNWNYNPVRLYRKGQLSLVQLKKHLYFALPAAIGWWYLYLRFWKNRKKKNDCDAFFCHTCI